MVSSLLSFFFLPVHKKCLPKTHQVKLSALQEIDLHHKINGNNVLANPRARHYMVTRRLQRSGSWAPGSWKGVNSNCKGTENRSEEKASIMLVKFEAILIIK